MRYNWFISLLYMYKQRGKTILHFCLFAFLDSCKVEDATSLEQAVTPRDILRILKNNKLFTPSDVICMQYLLKRTDCQDLYTQCIKYAEEQDALCFYEKPLGNI